MPVLFSTPLAALLALGALITSTNEEVRVLDATLHHLGDSRTSWPDVPPEPEGARYELDFESAAIPGESVLFVQHRDVDDPWHIELNGVRVASLRVTKLGGSRPYVLPPGSIVAGTNRLAVLCDRTTDDIVIGDVRLDPRPLEVALALGDVEIDVVDPGGRGIPARITIYRDAKEPAELYSFDPTATAVRPGVAYAKDGRLRARIPSGSYTYWVCRGMEWSLEKGALSLRQGGVQRRRVVLERQVDTTGWIASDTHIHTLTYSGHGDSTIEERMITLAGEGVELAISTDHNHQTDYAAWQEATGMNGWYTSVTGNEVTTKVGHFNAFPLAANGALPDHTPEDWVQIVDNMRTTGAKVVILNHPRWPEGADAPFVRFGFDPRSGAFRDGRTLPVDGIELLNSTWLLDDAMEKFRDWFAILNRGGDIKAIGSSDSHTVGDPVGQGRTYVRSATDDPGALDVPALCDAFVDGRTSIALGIFVEIDVMGSGPGEVVSARDDAIEVDVRVAAPAWIRPTTARLYANGELVAETRIDGGAHQPTDRTWTANIPRPAHDAWLVAVVLGEGVDGPYWPTMKQYTCGATNPVRLDVDGDGTFRWPRETAEMLLTDLESLGVVDQGVGLQLADLALELPEHHAALRDLIRPGGPLEPLAPFVERRIGR